MFEKIPTVLMADELIDKAFRRAHKVSTYDKDKVLRTRSTQIDRIMTMQHVIADTLGAYIMRFPSFDVEATKIMKKKGGNIDEKYLLEKHENVNQFYYQLIDLKIGVQKMKKALGALSWCVKTVNDLAADHIRELKKTEKIPEMKTIKRRAMARIASVVKQIGDELAFLNKARDELRALPVFFPHAKTIVVAGAPNVGKSSLVRLVSTAKPMVATYPFTTKMISIGYFELRRSKYQIIDTPGLLDRPLEKRNAIERQAILALTYLADVIIFMLDPSETCGYSMAEQLRLLEQTKANFSGVPLIEIENKKDLAQTDSKRLKISSLADEGDEKNKEKELEIGALLTALNEGVKAK